MSKKEILKAFKALHRITQTTFEGDKRALLEAKNKINAEFRKDLEPESLVDDKLKTAKKVGKILLQNVVQLSKKQESENNYGEFKSRQLKQTFLKCSIYLFRAETPQRNDKIGQCHI
jgi:hypothetical protein